MIEIRLDQYDCRIFRPSIGQVHTVLKIVTLSISEWSTFRKFLEFLILEIINKGENDEKDDVC